MTSKEAEIKVAGTVCAMCASAIENSLLGLDGIQQARVNLATETAYVDYDPEKVHLPEMETAIRDDRITRWWTRRSS